MGVLLSLAIVLFVFLIGAFGGAIVKKSDAYQLGKSAKPLIIQCQAELPRDQECVLKAVPEESE